MFGGSWPRAAAPTAVQASTVVNFTTVGPRRGLCQQASRRSMSSPSVVVARPAAAQAVPVAVVPKSLRLSTVTAGQSLALLCWRRRANTGRWRRLIICQRRHRDQVIAGGGGGGGDAASGQAGQAAEPVVPVTMAWA